MVQATVEASLLYASETRPYNERELAIYQRFMNRVIRGITLGPKETIMDMKGKQTQTDLRRPGWTRWRHVLQCASLDIWVTLLGTRIRGWNGRWSLGAAWNRKHLWPQHAKPVPRGGISAIISLERLLPMQRCETESSGRR